MLAIIKFEDRFFTSEGLPTICKASLKEALNCDPSLSDSSTRRIALAGLNGGLPLEFINVIGWNPCNFQRVELNLANFVSVSVEDAKRAFQLSRISFEEKILLPKVKPKFAQVFGILVLLAGFREAVLKSNLNGILRNSIFLAIIVKLMWQL